MLTRMKVLNPTHTSEIVVYDTTSENDLVWGVGTGCHGVVHIALEYLSHPPTWAEQALSRLRDRKSVALSMPWSDTGVGNTSLADARCPTDSSEPCFRQVLEPPPHLVVCGAGEDARPLVRLARTLGWTITVIDPRATLVSEPRWPEADATRCVSPEQAGSAVAWDRATAAVIMTHHYRYDLPLLATLLPLDLPYLGLLGPRRRAERLLRDLPAEVRTTARAAIGRLHAPVGLDLGGDGPEAVALAIVAEIQARFTGRDGRPLREREGGIHDA